MFSPKTKRKTTELAFKNVSVNINGNDVIQGASASICNGQILGMFGPKGCGKTALLWALSGHTDISEGEAVVAGIPIERARNKVALCESPDVFLPTLTVAETMKYSAILRLPLELPTEEKIARVKQVTDLMELNTVSDIIVQMLSPSLKKRLAIACEMVMNPSVIFIDDPLSALSLDDSLQLIRILKYYVQNTNRMLVIAFHACSGSVFRICSKFMFLYKTQVAFYGKADELLQFLRGIDLQCPHGYNPAEYLLELLCEDTLNDEQPVQEKIISAFHNITLARRSATKTSLTFLPETSAVTDYFDARAKDEVNGNTKHAISYSAQEDEVEVLLEPSLKTQTMILKTKSQRRNAVKKSRRYLTPYCHQFLVLLVRNFHNARRRILFPVSIVQNVYILVVCVLVWWRMERKDDTIMDRMGLFFFTIVQWAFFALLDVILTFPKELKVIQKERRHNQYSLSAFCLSKTVSEIPLAILQPCIFMCVMYWVANLNGVQAFFGSIGVLILDVLAAQSIGLLVGTALRPPWTVSIVSLGLLSMMLWGGAFNTPPTWLRWGKFASYFYYGLNGLIVLEFTDAPPIQCSAGSMVPLCNLVDPLTNQTKASFDSEIVLTLRGINWPLWCYVTVLAGIMVVTRLLWYCVMRRRKIS